MTYLFNKTTYNNLKKALVKPTVTREIRLAHQDYPFSQNKSIKLEREFIYLKFSSSVKVKAG